MKVLLHFLVPLLIVGGMVSLPFTALSDDRTVKVRGRAEVTVTGEIIQLGDIAEVSSFSVSDDDIVIGLQKIFLAQSPQPGKLTTISASKVLERLQEEGIDLNQIGYTFPRSMSVRRASREVSSEEMQSFVEKGLQEWDRDLVLKSIHYRSPLHVEPDAFDCAATPSGPVTQGKVVMRVSCPVSGRSVSAAVEAKVEQWREVPVASRTLPRGSLIALGDLAMARMDIARLPIDSVSDQTQVMGLATTQDIGAGEVLRRSKIAVPPMVTNGSRVTMRYRSGALLVTASGTALENGIEGQEIRVRNESSRRTITGKVIEPGLIEIRGMR